MLTCCARMIYDAFAWDVRLLRYGELCGSLGVSVKSVFESFGEDSEKLHSRRYFKFCRSFIARDRSVFENKNIELWRSVFHFMELTLKNLPM